MDKDLNNGAIIDTNKGTVINQPGGTILLADKDNLVNVPAKKLKFEQMCFKEKLGNLVNVPARKLKFERMRLKEKLGNIDKLYNFPARWLSVGLMLLYTSMSIKLSNQLMIVIVINGIVVPILWILHIYSQHRPAIKRYKTIIENIDAELNDRN